MASNPGKIVKALFAFQQNFTAAKEKLRKETFTGEHESATASMDGRGNVLSLTIPGASDAVTAAVLEALRKATASREAAAESMLKNVNLQEIPWLGKLIKD